ncbi:MULTISPECIES: hypothetical protein [Burkholderia]|uniref:Copper chaperone PCu(A)C n=1 Tax=Burkholderia sola TaxID=2843302 RepID=A0ABV2CHS5_9BURK|nr:MULTISPECIES: hypothetical protein [unclassified Burkholderia]MBP0610664.1 hypothetical protein [Burkholderia sp. CpTa8-5]MBP0717542.1 hypothetical protein [Burkholderia sp. AcTa6-5]
MTRAATGRVVRAAGVVFVAVLVGLAWRSMVGSAGSPALIAPGNEILSVQPDEVMSFVYTAGTLSVNAHRVQPATPFSVRVTFADGRASRQCVAPPGLADRLAPLTTLIARGSVPSGAELATAFPTPLGTLEMRDRIASEPLPALVFHGGAADTAAVAVTGLPGAGGRAIVVDPAARAALALLAGGCDTLARR